MSVWVTLGLMLLAVAALTALAVSAMMARILLRPPRMTEGKAFYYLRRTTPADLGLPFEEIEFIIRDAAAGGNARLRTGAWWIPAAAPSNRTVVLIHGYLDARVGAIAWAPMLRSLGCNILAYDLRAHGQSGGKYSTAGYFERDDLDQILDDLRVRFPDAAHRIILFGISLGGTIAAAVAAGRADTGDIAAVILESPYADFREAFFVRADAHGSPGPLIQRLAFWMAEKMSRADLSRLRPPDLIRRIPCPVMVIESSDDLVDNISRSAIESAIADRLRRNLPTATYRAPGWHVTGLAEDPVAYTAAVTEFFTSVQ